MIRNLLAAAMVLALCSPAVAHDLDCRGNPVPTKIKEGCCGAGDALQLKPGQWRGSDEDGYEVLIDGAWIPVVHKEWIAPGILGKAEKVRALPSDDGCDWVWYRRRGADGFMTSRLDPGEFNFYCLQISMNF
jgi:hypothetical protein